jgi:putative spermidine/putrescine transport system substrate-binding protein
MIDQAWPKMAELKPNVLSIFENQTAVMQVAEGQADAAGIFYSKSVYPYTVQGAPLDMCYPREGIFSPDWTLINPMRPQLIEKYNQVFSA